MLDIREESRLKYNPPLYKDLRERIDYYFVRKQNFSSFSHQDFTNDKGRLKDRLPYHYQLLCKEWLDIKIKILERDNCTCQRCGMKNEYFLLKLENIIEINYSKCIPISDEEFQVEVNKMVEDWKNGTLGRMAKKRYDEKKYNSLVQRNVNWFNSRRKVKTLPGSYVWNSLEIHHRYYVNEAYAWEYDLSALITLCSNCHREVHQLNSPSVLIFREHPNPNKSFEDQKGLLLDYSFDCDRCHGKGFILEYKHIENGICFACYGIGHVH